MRSFFTLLFCLFSLSSFAQKDTVANPTIGVSVPSRFYVGNGLDLFMLSTAFVERPGQDRKLTTPRFTAFVNIGFTFNYDPSPRVGLFTGLGIRNMGYIDKFNDGDSTIKRRVYSLGVPLGIKIGNLRNRNFVFFGGGVDLPFHYKEKRFTSRTDKKKIKDWFPDRTQHVLPFAFVGYSVDPGITLKLQYYPTNFLNTDFGGQNFKPFAGYNVNLLLLSLGIDIHYNQYKIQQREYLEMKGERERK